MKNKWLKIIYTTIFLPLVMTSCGGNVLSTNSVVYQTSENITYYTKDDEGTATIKIYKDNNSTSTQRYISPSKVDLKYTYNSLSAILGNNENVCPSIGDVNLLVIPVHLPSSSNEKYNTDEVREDIETVFFSSNSQRMGFKSVKEFYYESSYGKLNFQGTVTDWFDATSLTNIKNVSQITGGTNGTIVTEILPKAVEWAKNSQGINLKDFDKNRDGSIDAVWLVYDHLDWSTEFELNYKNNPNYSGEGLNEMLWNVTYWDTNTLPINYDDPEQADLDPTTSAFSWASFDMMYTPYAGRDSKGFVDISHPESIKLDSHTFIHETGHLLGLEDYYTYDSNYHPLGQSSMMDQNVFDLDSHSKMLLGWVTPYVVYGTSEILIPRATVSDRAVIVIPSNYQGISSRVEQAARQNKLDSFRYEFNPFSEYILIDLFTPDGLNAYDAFGPSIYGRENLTINTSGVRIYHVDSRLFKCNYVEYEGGYSLNFTKGYVWDEEELGMNEYILMPISNQRNEATRWGLPANYDNFDQIRLIEANKTNTFNYGYPMTSDSLFTTESDPFSIESFAQQFFSSNYSFNGGGDLPFRIKVETLKGIS